MDRNILKTKRGRDLAKRRANLLEDKASQTIEKTKQGHSGLAAKLILEVNLERLKAGLIRGKLKR